MSSKYTRRNLEICTRWSKYEDAASIARDFGVSRQRIHQILRANGAKPLKERNRVRQEWVNILRQRGFFAKEVAKLFGVSRVRSSVGVTIPEGVDNQRYWRERAIEHLGGRCVHCGYSDNIRALDLDHINNTGWANERETQPFIYRAIVRGDRTDFQVLCKNCNWIKFVENN